MSDTIENKIAAAKDSKTAPTGPVIILVNPQMGENIGAAARAMLNCNLTEMRLVAPRDGWPNEKAMRLSAGAYPLIENAKIFDTTAEAIADLHYVIATTARIRDMCKPILTPQGAAVECTKRDQQGQRCGILYGPERSGLVNEDVSAANAILNVPLNPEFSSLNLAQAVLLTGHNWYSHACANECPDLRLNLSDTRPATQEQVQNMLKHLEDELDDGGFFTSADRKPSTMRSIQNMFGRLEATDQDVQTLHGIIRALAGWRTNKNNAKAKAEKEKAKKEKAKQQKD